MSRLRASTIALLLTVSVFLVYWTIRESHGRSFWDRSTENLGATGTPVLLGLVLAGIVWLTKRSGFWTTFNVALLSLSSVLGVAQAISQTADESAPAANVMLEPCTASASLPGEPQRQSIQLPSPLDEAEAISYVYADTEGFYKIDCYNFPINLLAGEMTLSDTLYNLALIDGVEHQGIFSAEQPFPHSKMLASKEVGGDAVHYEYRLLEMTDFFILIVIGSSFPELSSARSQAVVNSFQALD